MNFKTEQERTAYHEKLTDIQKLVVRQSGWRTCLNCINWREVPMSGQTMICGLYKATPPPNIIVHGCRDWEDDIPF